MKKLIDLFIPTNASGLHPYQSSRQKLNTTEIPNKITDNKPKNAK